MHDHELFKTRVDRILESVVEQEIAELIAIDEVLAPVAEQVRSAVMRGKRLRAAFCYWGWRAAGQPDRDAAVKLAAVMELVHAAALVHDDIVDDSPTRRGVPSVHVALRSALRPDRRGSDESRHGAALAIMVGDLLIAMAGHLFADCGLPAGYLKRARPLWSALTRELMAGECLEILVTGQRPRLERSLKINRLKTAKYTVERPLQIGGVVAGAPDSVLESYTAYGVPLGEAYQLRDDLLGVFGDPRTTGKSNLDDLCGHKPTAMLALVLDEADQDARRALASLLGRRDLGVQDLQTIREIIASTGVPSRIESMIKERTAAALDAIHRARLPSDATLALTDLADALLDRVA
ncbi:polyprenyl synthetase family protein [Actinoallomurus sp. NPDC050550]|uniref:polyprenyl synthetase family protein n=1 Tax=Actinoallomurus sp. NPDC050550 TaxID=3154937 RepID=UPI0033C48254